MAKWSDFETHPVGTAKRIEELEVENNLLKTSGIVEVAVRNPSVMEYMKHWEGRAEAAEALLPEAVKAGMLYGAKINPLVWGYHPCGAIAAPPTGHAYIIDTRMKGRCYSVKGFNPERQFASLDEAKVVAQADYEQRIRTAMDEPDPETIDRIVAQLKEGRG